MVSGQNQYDSLARKVLDLALAIMVSRVCCTCWNKCFFHRYLLYLMKDFNSSFHRTRKTFLCHLTFISMSSSSFNLSMFWSTNFVFHHFVISLKMVNVFILKFCVTSSHISPHVCDYLSHSTGSLQFSYHSGIFLF